VLNHQLFRRVLIMSMLPRILRLGPSRGSFALVVRLSLRWPWSWGKLDAVDDGLVVFGAGEVVPLLAVTVQREMEFQVADCIRVPDGCATAMRATMTDGACAGEVVRPEDEDHSARDVALEDLPCCTVVQEDVLGWHVHLAYVTAIGLVKAPALFERQGWADAVVVVGALVAVAITCVLGQRCARFRSSSAGQH